MVMITTADRSDLSHQGLVRLIAKGDGVNGNVGAGSRLS